MVYFLGQYNIYIYTLLNSPITKIQFIFNSFNNPGNWYQQANTSGDTGI